MKKRIFLFFIFIISFFVLTSCTFFRPSTTKKLIVTTLYPQYDMVKKIIGSDRATQGLFDVVMIIKPGQDSHTYDPSINDIITIKNADIFIYTSDEMETWVNNIEFSASTVVVNLSKSKLSDTEYIELLKVEDHDEDSNEDTNNPSHEHTHVHSYDPHYWLYPIYASYMVEAIKQAIINFLPDNPSINSVFSANAEEYKEKLYQIDLDIKMICENAQNKTMYFGSPFAFYYLAYWYNLDYELIYQTCSTETEPSVEVLTNIINKMRENDIKYIFSKELINTKACEMIAFHTNATILELHSGHNVSALDFNNPNISFISIMKQNVVNLAKMLKVDQNIIQQLEQAKEGVI